MITLEKSITGLTQCESFHHRAICHSPPGDCHSGLDPESTTALTPADMHDNFSRFRVKPGMTDCAEGKTFTSRGLTNSGPSEHIFLRIDLERDLDKLADTSKNTMPMLFFLGTDSSSSLWHQAFLDDIIERHVNAATALKSLGHHRATIAADQDGLFARILSPRFSNWSFEKRLEPLLETFKRVSKVLEEVWVLLTIEELMPGGMDATDGVAVARALENAGLKTLIVASGTKDFLPLYDRKVTKKKKSQENDFYSNEPNLASALWVRQYTTLKIWALLDIDDPVQAQDLAEQMGLEGIIQKG